MKKLLTTVLVLLSFLAFGQNYKLFNENSKKLFISETTSGFTFGISFDSVKAVGTDSVYFSYTGLGTDILVDSNCYYWGWPWCIQQNKPSCIGLNTIFDNNEHYKFITAQQDTLFFNFNFFSGDSSLFYQDSLQKFYIVFEGTDTSTVLNVTDSAKFYRISHTDTLGNVINSSLNNKKIIVGKEIGLIDFFRIDSFPQVLESIKLIGNKSPNAGLNKLTNEMIYDHQPGDEIQYFKYYHKYGGYPLQNYNRYIKHTFLNRINTQDSIIYKVARITFDVDSNTQFFDTIFLKYKRYEMLGEIPFDYINQSYLLRVKKLYKADYCSLNLWTFTINPLYKKYCSYYNCWCNYDTQGPTPQSERTYVCGLGLYIDEHTIPPYSSNANNVVYFKKNGIKCGNEVVLNVNKKFMPKDLFTVFPNPTGDFLNIKTKINREGILFVSTLNGQEVFKTEIKDRITKIDIENLPKGIYLIKFVCEDFVGVKKIVKQ